MTTSETKKTASETVTTDFKMDLPNFSKLPELTTLNTQFISSFNTGLTIYQCLNYLQGYVELTYEGLVKLVDELTEFRTELITYIETMEKELNTRIDIEELARKTADEKEAKAREEADKKLDDKIETEIETRMLEDTKLNSHIQDEIQDRVNADNELKAKDEALQVDINTRVLRAGDTMTGDLNVPNVILSGALRTSTGSGTPAILAGYSSKVEVGTSGRAFNINGSTTRPTYNTVNQIAFLSDIDGSGGSGNVTIEIEEPNSSISADGSDFLDISRYLDGNTRFIIIEYGETGELPYFVIVDIDNLKSVGSYHNHVVGMEFTESIESATTHIREIEITKSNNNQLLLITKWWDLATFGYSATLGQPTALSAYYIGPGTRMATIYKIYKFNIDDSTSAISTADETNEGAILDDDGNPVRTLEEIALEDYQESLKNEQK